jgi:phosphoglycolate phosphatase-like HAD superfamily hydrolase
VTRRTIEVVVFDVGETLVGESRAWTLEAERAGVAPLTFFAQVETAAAVGAERIAHDGDRVDDDVLPARAAGMFSVHIRRGPLGHIHAGRVDAARADARVTRMDEIPGLLASL